MTAPAFKLELVDTSAGRVPAAVAATPTAEPVIRLQTPPRAQSKLITDLCRRASSVLANVVPPLIVLALLLLLWQLAFHGPKSSLPSPMKVWADSKDLIVSPFFVNGPQDIGLGLRVLTSLQAW